MFQPGYASSIFSITLNISTNYVLQTAIEANCKRPPYSLILQFTASHKIIYGLLQKPYFNGLCIDDMQISKELE
jgi:hypothetical protein